MTCTFADSADDAEKAISQAQNAIARLVSKEVYDVELAEGITGSDAPAELATAARAIRNVKRIAAWRREMLLADEAAGAAGQ